MLYAEIIRLVQLWPWGTRPWPVFGMSRQALRNGALVLEPVALLTSPVVTHPPTATNNFIFLALPRTHLPSVLWHRWFGDRKGIWPVEMLGVGLLVVLIWLELCTSYSSSKVVTTTSFVSSSNKIQNGDILVAGGCPGKWLWNQHRCLPTHIFTVTLGQIRSLWLLPWHPYICIYIHQCSVMIWLTEHSTWYISIQSEQLTYVHIKCTLCRITVSETSPSREPPYGQMPYRHEKSPIVNPRCSIPTTPLRRLWRTPWKGSQLLPTVNEQWAAD